MKMRRIVFATAVGAMSLICQAVEIKTVGNWKVSFDEKDSRLKLVNEKSNISIDGNLGFVSRNDAWKIVLARDAAVDRLSLLNPGNTVLGYVSFRGEGNRISAEVLHRAGANFFPGILTYMAKAKVRETSFACRTIPAQGERVLNFADGAGDTSLNDSIFAREEDFAVRFFSMATKISTLKNGEYAVSLAADIDDSSRATITIEADGAYFKSRWAPGYHPIDRSRCPKAPTGWMSWNTYFDKAGSAENLAEARIGAKFLKPFGLDIWSIESWQDNSLWLPVGDFHNLDLSCYRPQFPEGMKKLADEIRALGFVPGLWMPLYGTGDKKFHDEHYDWFVHDAKGKPIDCWNGRYMLDYTNEAVQDHIRKITHTAATDWGYKFFKFDGMANTPRKFERPEIRARFKKPNDPKWFENSVKTLREGIGQSIMLGCMGDFTGTEAQFLDASRLGSDVVGCYRGIGENYNPLGNSNLAQMPVKWHNVVHQAECTFAQIFVNNLMFYTDPDTLLVGYSLEQHEAEVMATIIGLPGQLMFLGDRLGMLRPERMKILQQVLPVADIHPQNLYPYAASAMIPVWNLTVTRPYGSWHVVALINFDDGPKNFDVALESLGLDPAKKYATYEFWRQRNAGDIEKSLKADLAMRSVQLFAIREVKDHPQFVGDDRHITMGAVELNDEKWDKANNSLTVKMKVVGGFPLTFAVRIPGGYTYKGVTANEGASVSAKTEKGMVRVTVNSRETRDVTLTLIF